MATRTAIMRNDVGLVESDGGATGNNTTTATLGWTDAVSADFGRLVFHFDLKLKHGTISAATLTLKPTDNAAVASALAVYPVKGLDRNWVDSQATWDDKSTSVAWGAAGGNPDTGIAPGEATMTTDGADIIFNDAAFVAICQTGIDQNGRLNLLVQRSVESGLDSEQVIQMTGHGSGPSTLVLTFTETVRNTPRLALRRSRTL